MEKKSKNIFARIPLTYQILIALGLGIAVGIMLQGKTYWAEKPRPATKAMA